MCHFEEIYDDDGGSGYSGDNTTNLSKANNAFCLHFSFLSVDSYLMIGFGLCFAFEERLFVGAACLFCFLLFRFEWEMHVEWHHKLFKYLVRLCVCVSAFGSSGCRWSRRRRIGLMHSVSTLAWAPISGDLFIELCMENFRSEPITRRLIQVRSVKDLPNVSLWHPLARTQN